MEIFILLHRTKVSRNDKPMFDPILVNAKDIVAVEPSDTTYCQSEVHLKLPLEQMRFQPLYCKESFKEILNLLKEKGIEIVTL